MRKILLGTTAVIGAALLAPGAFAQPAATQVPAGGGAPTAGQAPLVPQTGSGGVGVQPSPAIAGAGGLTVRLGGYFAFTGGYIQDDWDRGRSRNSSSANGGGPGAQARQRQDFRNDMELNVFIDGRAANGLTYGAVFEFQMDNVGGTAAGDGTTVSFDEMYGFITLPNLGTLRFGQEDNAASLLQIRAPASQALGGDAEWDEFIVQNGLFNNPYLIAGNNDGNDATKVIYLSPQFAGFDFGLSYAANGGEGERTDAATSTSLAQRDRTGLENEFSAAIRYRGTFGPVGVQAGIGGTWAEPARLGGSGAPVAIRAQNYSQYSVGAAITAYGFSFGGEFTWGAYNGATRNALAAGLDDSYHYMLGGTYTMGPVVFGAVFGQAFQDNGVAVTRNTAGVVTNIRSIADRTHTVWGVGVAYNLAPGLVLFGIYNNVNDENVPTAAPVNARYTATPGGTTGTTLASFNGSNTRTINVGIVGIRLAF